MSASHSSVGVLHVCCSLSIHGKQGIVCTLSLLQFLKMDLLVFFCRNRLSDCRWLGSGALTSESAFRCSVLL